MRGDILIIPPSGLVLSAGWQPIETAPMNGDEVVLFFPYAVEGGLVTAGYWYRPGPGVEPYWYSDRVNSGVTPPTYWQPLPPTPEAAQ